METNKLKKKKSSRSVSAGLIIIGCFILAVLIYHFIFGNPANFMNNDPANHPLQGNLLGTVHKGGMIVPVILTLLLTVICISIERLITIKKAKGTGSLLDFVFNVKECLENGDLKTAQSFCDLQKGSVANVVSSALRKYDEVQKNDDMAKSQKMVAIQREVEEATTLELPTMEQNLPVVATITTLGTLMGLLGTVIGMIRAFSALATSGGTDSLALSTGISEALVNTAFGIATGALAVISYNYFTSKIDGIIYSIDEIGFSIVQTFAEKNK